MAIGKSEWILRDAVAAVVDGEVKDLEAYAMPEDYVPSLRFQDKMNKLNNRLNHHITRRIGKAAAIFLVVVVGLVAVNTVSAAVFGFNPWREATSIFFPDVEMEQKTYEKNDTINQENMAKPISDVPTYIPEGYSEIDYQKNSTTIAMEWQKPEKDGSIKGIAYSRDTMGESTSFIEDTAYDKVITTDVAGYIAKICHKSDRVSISWKDKCYMYSIWTNEVDISKSTLIRMSESIYK